MPVLFAISVLCLCVVLWSAVSIARHVTNTRRRRRPLARKDGFNEVFFEDKMQQIREHAVAARQAAAAPASVQWAPLVVRREAPTPMPAHKVQPQLAPAPAPVAADIVPRKMPQPAAAQIASYRADWDYFNKDLGDLTDPYETASRETTAARSATRR